MTPPWAIVLAGGQGARLRPLVRQVCGDERPKQFANIMGSKSLLRQTLDRVALRIAPQRTLIITCHEHEEYVQREFPDTSIQQIFSQMTVERPPAFCSRLTGFTRSTRTLSPPSFRQTTSSLRKRPLWSKSCAFHPLLVESRNTWSYSERPLSNRRQNTAGLSQASLLKGLILASRFV